VVGRDQLSAASGSVIGLLALTLIAATGAAFAAATAWSDQGAAHRSAARLAADRLETSLTAATNSVAGVGALALDGSVDADEFEVFGTEVAASSGLAALAFFERVEDADRAVWEASTGLSMKDTDGRGGFVPAQARDVHVVIRYAAPVNATTRSVLGFDLMSDPIRARGIDAADSADGAQFVGPIATVADARPGLFMTAAVRDVVGELVGFVATGIALDDAAQRLSALTGVRDVGVVMDGAPLLNERQGSASESFMLAGRTFTVSASSGTTASWWLPGVLTAATVVLLVGAVRAARRERSERARERRATQRSQLLARLAEELATATSTDGTAQLAADHGGRVVGASYTNVATRDPSDPAKLRVVHDTAMAVDLADRFAVQNINDDLPLPRAARTGTIVWIANREEYAAAFHDAIDDVVAAGIHAVCCVPLSLGADPNAGVIGFAFDHPLEPADRAEIESAATIVSQLTGRALDRASVRELVQHRVDLLSDFARELTTVQSSNGVASVVADMIPPLLDLDSARLVDHLEGSTEPEVRSYRLAPQTEDHLIVRLRRGRVWAPIDETLANTVADLVGGALSRTRLHDQERAVLRRIQHSLLTAPPDIEGFEVAVGYRSALTAIDMGGDWYSIIDTDDAVYAVIGDVAGHGPGAVALMAEVKTVTRHLLATGTPLNDAVAHADRTLQRRHAYASMIVIRIDKHTNCLDYLNAGHPPALCFTATGIVSLADVHRPWLGVAPTQQPTTTQIPFEPDDLLLLFTDGLVEQRDEPLDDSIRKHLHTLDTTPPTQHIVDRLLYEREQRDNASATDDDIAVIAIRRSPSQERAPALGRPDAMLRADNPWH
jgi:GAF domain-containing protein